MEDRDEKGRFAKGHPGNPLGRPKKPEIEQLRLAIEKVQKEKNTGFLEHLVRKAYVSDTVLIALAKKFLPDLKAIEANVLTGVREPAEPITAEEELAELEKRRNRLLAAMDAPDAICYGDK